MIAVDSNVLVYAHREDSPFHSEAKQAVSALAESPRSWAIPWPCAHEFYSVVTSRRYDPPSSPLQAVAQLQAWFSSPSVVALSETRDHLSRLLPLLRDVRGAMVHDAKIAAICLSHGVTELLTMDSDFSRFPALRTRSLLA